MARPDAPSPSAFRALQDVDYNEDAWERDVGGWTIAFSLESSKDDIRDKQIGLFDNNDNDVCRGTSIFPADDVKDFNLITISCYDTLYGFCMFDANYMTVTVNTICTAQNSFRGTGKFILALVTKYAHACTNAQVLVIFRPVDKAIPFYEQLGFKEPEEHLMRSRVDAMVMSLDDKSDGVHFAPMEEMRGTKRPRSDRLMLLVD